MKIATCQLASCCGCHMGLVNLGAGLFKALGQGELVYSPVLSDEKSIDSCDIALVEGGIRNNEDAERIRELRKKSNNLIALGTCACFGGIPGIGSAFATVELLTKAYGRDFFPEGMPLLTQRVFPLDSSVIIDFYLPGCPPPPELLKNTMEQLLTGHKPERIDLPVCAECNRVVKKELQSEIKRTVDNFPEVDECLLSQGFICLGSVSRGGCEASCTHAGVPCMGCRGPIDRVFLEPTHGVLYDLTRRISHFTGKTEEEVVGKMSDLLHTLYRFTLSVPEMRRKDVERIYTLIHKITI
jgi:F420-non-reducing hydrogenase small subunit